MADSEATPLLPALPRRHTTAQRVYQAIALCVGLLTLLAVAFALRPLHAREDSPWTHLPGPKPGLRNPNYLARGRHGAVATEVNICSELGLDVLKDGGNAVDAAIAACLCIGNTNMFSSGIGGGGFMVIRPSDGSHPVSVDFRETAPIGAHPNMYADKSPLASKFGGLAVGVPGELRGLEAAYKLHGGRVSWKRLFEPNIKLARSHRVGRELARRLGIPVSGLFQGATPLTRAHSYCPASLLMIRLGGLSS
jgi:gamma-glutamyltranspeptidase/glutathione hydrolase/leukotriene-C4 hydrolase